MSFLTHFFDSYNSGKTTHPFLVCNASTYSFKIKQDKNNSKLNLKNKVNEFDTKLQKKTQNKQTETHISFV